MQRDNSIKYVHRNKSIEYVKINKVIKMKEKLYRFMQGRYGTDKLNQFILYCEIFFLILSLFFRKNIIVNILFYLSIIIYLFRALSKNYVARSIENQKFIRIQAKITHKFQALYKNMKDKQNKYLVCPDCAQIIRVPRNKGKIEVRCPSCRKSFDAKS